MNSQNHFDFFQVSCLTIGLEVFMTSQLKAGGGSQETQWLWERLFGCSGETLYCVGSEKKYYYASPSSGETYRDRRLTNNFELWVEIFCVPTCFHMRIPEPCLSVCLSVCPWLRQYQSYISNWCINRKIFTSITAWKPIKLIFFQRSSKLTKLNFVHTLSVRTPRKEIGLASSISVLH